MGTNNSDITALLESWHAGDQAAGKKALEAMYDDLRRIAKRERARWNGNHTLTTNALANELYLKLERRTSINAKHRTHFNQLAARSIRNILVDYAKQWKRQKRGGHLERATFTESVANPPSFEKSADEILLVDQCMDRLRQLNERMADVVEMHFFGGLTYDEIATSLGVTKKTVYRDWIKAKALLKEELVRRDTQIADSKDAPQDARSQ